MNEHQTISQWNATVAPAARVDELVITEAGDEVLVYDKRRHQIHHLNHASAVIWRLCDGTRSIQALTEAAMADLGRSVDAEVVELAVTKLAEANLLAQPATGNFINTTYNRRKMLRRAAVAGAIAVPAIVSMTAPSAAQVPSCLFTQECTNKNTGDACCVPCNGILNVGVCTHTTGTVYVCVAGCVG